MRKAICWKLKENCPFHPRETVVVEDTSEYLPKEIRVINGVETLVTVCPPAYDRKLEFSYGLRRPEFMVRQQDLLEDDEVLDQQHNPGRSSYRSLSNATAGQGCFTLSDHDDVETHDGAVGFRAARDMVATLRRYVHGDKELPDHWRRLLGCDLATFRSHIEAMFAPDMRWGNWGDWHLDHIKPLYLFSLDSYTELCSACHYTNLQPLWSWENIRKGKLYKN